MRRACLGQQVRLVQRPALTMEVETATRLERHRAPRVGQRGRRAVRARVHAAAVAVERVALRTDGNRVVEVLLALVKITRRPRLFGESSVMHCAIHDAMHDVVHDVMHGVMRRRV